MHDASGPRDLLRAGGLDAELMALLWLLLDARMPLVVVSAHAAAARRVIDGLAGLLPPAAHLVPVAPDDDFAWLPEAVELGWRRSAQSRVDAGGAASSADDVLVVHGLASGDGVGGERARIVVRALSLGYGLLATMDGDGLDDALNRLHDPAVGTDADERSRLGVVLAVREEGGVARVTAAHYVRPVALDTHGHVQRPAAAILAAWNRAAGRFDHFAWGVVPDLAGRLGVAPLEFERDQARRAAALREPAC